ncbi:RNA polymerase subunit sigma-70, partial [Streptomyces sp. NPDC048279]
LPAARADLAYQEVAEAPDIPVGPVRSRRKVRTALGADPAFVVDTVEVLQRWTR